MLWEFYIRQTDVDSKLVGRGSTVEEFRFITYAYDVSAKRIHLYVEWNKLENLISMLEKALQRYYGEDAAINCEEVNI